MVLDEKSGIMKIIQNHPLWAMSVCTIFHDNLSGKCILAWWTNYIPIPRTISVAKEGGTAG